MCGPFFPEFSLGCSSRAANRNRQYDGQAELNQGFDDVPGVPYRLLLGHWTGRLPYGSKLYEATLAWCNSSVRPGDAGSAGALVAVLRIKCNIGIFVLPVFNGFAGLSKRFPHCPSVPHSVGRPVELDVQRDQLIRKVGIIDSRGQYPQAMSLSDQTLCLSP